MKDNEGLSKLEYLRKLIAEDRVEDAVYLDYFLYPKDEWPDRRDYGIRMLLRNTKLEELGIFGIIGEIKQALHNVKYNVQKLHDQDWPHDEFIERLQFLKSSLDALQLENEKFEVPK